MRSEEILTIFPTAVVARYVNKEHEEIDLSTLEFLQNDTASGQTTSPHLNVLERDPRFEKLSAFINGCVKDYLQNIICYDYERFSIIHSWINRTQNNGFQRMHNHGNSIVSGCYYLKANRQNSPLAFMKGEYDSNPHFHIMFTRMNEYNAERHRCYVESGCCYLFPSNINHGYEQPNKGGERISLAFNVMLYGIGTSYGL